MNSSHAGKPSRPPSQLAHASGSVSSLTTAGASDSVAAGSGRFFLWRWINQVLVKSWARRQQRRQSRDRTMLAEAILGLSRATLVSVFGPPRIAAMGDDASDDSAITFWRAATWYYPLRGNEQMAMAIFFSEDRANYVEFFGIELMSR